MEAPLGGSTPGRYPKGINKFTYRNSEKFTYRNSGKFSVKRSVFVPPVEILRMIVADKRVDDANGVQHQILRFASGSVRNVYNSVFVASDRHTSSMKSVSFSDIEDRCPATKDVTRVKPSAIGSSAIGFPSSPSNIEDHYSVHDPDETFMKINLLSDINTNTTSNPCGTEHTCHVRTVLYPHEFDNDQHIAAVPTGSLCNIEDCYPKKDPDATFTQTNLLTGTNTNDQPMTIDDKHAKRSIIDRPSNIEDHYPVHDPDETFMEINLLSDINTNDPPEHPEGFDPEALKVDEFEFDRDVYVPGSEESAPTPRQRFHRHGPNASDGISNTENVRKLTGIHEMFIQAVAAREISQKGKVSPKGKRIIHHPIIEIS